MVFELQWFKHCLFFFFFFPKCAWSVSSCVLVGVSACVWLHCNLLASQTSDMGETAGFLKGNVEELHVRKVGDHVLVRLLLFFVFFLAPSLSYSVRRSSVWSHMHLFLYRCVTNYFWDFYFPKNKVKTPRVKKTRQNLSINADHVPLPVNQSWHLILIPEDSAGWVSHIFQSMLFTVWFSECVGRESSLRCRTWSGGRLFQACSVTFHRTLQLQSGNEDLRTYMVFQQPIMMTTYNLDGKTTHTFCCSFLYGVLIYNPEFSHGVWSVRMYFMSHRDWCQTICRNMSNQIYLKNPT